MLKSLFALSLLFVSSAAFAQLEEVPPSSIETADVVCKNHGGAYAVDLWSEVPRVWQTDDEAKEGIALTDVKVTAVTDAKRSYDVEGTLLASIRVSLSIRNKSATVRFQSLEDGSEIPSLPSYVCKFL